MLGLPLDWPMRLADPCDTWVVEAIQIIQASKLPIFNGQDCPNWALKSLLLVAEKIHQWNPKNILINATRIAKYSMFSQGAHFECSLQPLTPARAPQSPSIERGKACESCAAINQNLASIASCQALKWDKARAVSDRLLADPVKDSVLKMGTLQEASWEVTPKNMRATVSYPLRSNVLFPSCGSASEKNQIF